jgi:hypothetical protein
MDVISDHSQAPGGQAPEPQFDHRIRWGNVALALAALGAIVAAIGLPRGSAPIPTQQSIAPVTELVTAAVPTAPTAEATEPVRKKARAKRAPRKEQRPKAAPERSAAIAPQQAPTPTPAPATPAPTQPPAAEREFGL